MTALLRSPATVMQRLADSDEPMVLTRRGRPVAVLLSVEAYARAARDQQVLRMLALGEMEAAAGVGEDLDRVLADAEALLEEN
jgi:prevent-host-death family protein